jgi:hypothetical protein
MALRPFHGRRRRLSGATGVAALALLLGACAGGPSAGPGRPRGGPETPYPVVLADSEERRARALANWAAVLGDSAGPAPTPELRPVTATPVALPPSAAPRLPRVIIEEADEQSEEELRESLRRFITSAPALLGSELRDLSLVEIVDAPGGARLARYEQRPFHYPLRNGYGRVEIAFTPDLRVTGISSTAIPDGAVYRPLLRNVTRNRLTPERAAATLAGRALTYADAAGQPQTRAATPAADIKPREMVVYPLNRAGPPPALELRLAWELEVGGPGPPLLVYVDAVTGEQLGATTQVDSSR